MLRFGCETSGEFNSLNLLLPNLNDGMTLSFAEPYNKTRKLSERCLRDMYFRALAKQLYFNKEKS